MLLSEVGWPITGPVQIYCDNKAAINIAHDLVQHDRTEHVEVDRHFIKDHLKKGHICTPFVSVHNQLADMFIKGLSTSQFLCLVGKLGMWDIYSSA